MWARILIATTVLIAASSSRADDPPPEKKPAEKPTSEPLERFELDKRAARVAYETAKLGSELWAAGNFEGCFRLYQGSLLALQPMLDHRPKLAAMVRESNSISPRTRKRKRVRSRCARHSTPFRRRRLLARSWFPRRQHSGTVSAVKRR